MRTKKNTMRYVVIIEKAEHNFGAYVPDLPGCVAAGETKDEVMVLIRQAIDLHLEAMRSNGEEIPEPVSHGEYVEVS